MKRTTFLQLVVVEGRGSFPVDMLRYDACIPATESDANIIASSQYDPDPTTPTRVQLRRFAASKASRPTDGRWSSFGWQVVDVTEVV